MLHLIVGLLLPACLAGYAPAGLVPAGTPVSQGPPVRITFTPQGEEFRAAASEYDRLWAEEGARIVAAMERVSGLRFVSPVYADTAIAANVREVASNSGYRATPMTLRASYPFDTKRATLVHELGHRLQGGLVRRDEEEHDPLFLWLYDTWVALYGKEFADAQVTVERARGERYQRAWDGALALTTEQRAAKWRAFVAERLPIRR